jgi:hypothetical protein
VCCSCHCLAFVPLDIDGESDVEVQHQAFCSRVVHTNTKEACCLLLLPLLLMMMMQVGQ